MIVNVGRSRVAQTVAFALALAVLLALPGCAGGQRIGGASQLNVVRADAFPAPTASDLSASKRPYRVGPFDKLTIDVFGVADLKDREIQVDASGRISFPLVGTVEVAGKTPGEIENALEQLLRGGYIRDPQVTVNLKETVSQTVTISGEVKEPGIYPVIGQMTLVKAVATAKGLTEFSKLKEIVVFRTVGGREYAAIYDMRAIQRGSYPDPEIYPSDVVVVGDSQARRVFRDFLSASPLIAPLIYLILN